jgi:hydroxymethylbilane synthase
MRTIHIASGSDTTSLRAAAALDRLLKARPEPLGVTEVLVPSAGQAPPALEALVEALRSGPAEAAVLPASALPPCLPPGAALVAVIGGGDPRYRLVSRIRTSLPALPPGSRIAAGDALAAAQIRNLHPGLRVEAAPDLPDLFERLRHGAWAAACLSPEIVEAGSLWGLRAEPVAAEEIVPAVGQGRAAVLALSASSGAAERLAGAGDEEAAARLRAERTFLRHTLAVAGAAATARCVLGAAEAEVAGVLAAQDGSWMVVDRASGPPGLAGVLAREVADACVEAALERLAAREPLPAAVAF